MQRRVYFPGAISIGPPASAFLTFLIVTKDLTNNTVLATHHTAGCRLVSHSPPGAGTSEGLGRKTPVTTLVLATAAWGRYTGLGLTGPGHRLAIE